MKKRGFVISLILVAAIALVGFVYATKTNDVVGTYTYEKDGFGGDFSITLNDDGTFHYYEGMFSSYRGMGTWEQDGDILILSDKKEMGYGFVNYFKIDGKCLVFQEENSSNFLYLKLSDNAQFLKTDS